MDPIDFRRLSSVDRNSVRERMGGLVLFLHPMDLEGCRRGSLVLRRIGGLSLLVLLCRVLMDGRCRLGRRERMILGGRLVLKGRGCRRL